MKNNQTTSVLITGCSSGIGLETALVLKELNYNIFATVRDEKDIERLEDLGLTTFLVDVTDKNSIKDTLSRILILTNGTLDIVFNNAGYGQPGAIEDISTDTLKQQFEVNVFGLHEVTIQVLKIMKKQGYGKIIQHSSVLGLVSLKLRGAYNASKYAVEGLNDTLRLELRDTNISVSLLNTGPILSDFRKNAKDKLKENIDIKNSRFSNEYIKNLESQKSDVPFTLSANAVANVVVEIIKSKNPKPRYYITKATLLLGFAKRILSTLKLDNILEKI
jgi:short-subunit dehydrogenase